MESFKFEMGGRTKSDEFATHPNAGVNTQSESPIAKCHDGNWESEVEAEIKVHRSCHLEQPTAFLSKTAASDRDTATQMWAQAECHEVRRQRKNVPASLSPGKPVQFKCSVMLLSVPGFLCPGVLQFLGSAS